MHVTTVPSSVQQQNPKAQTNKKNRHTHRNVALDIQLSHQKLRRVSEQH